MRQRQSHIALIKLVACSFCDYVISFSTVVVATIRSSGMAAAVQTPMQNRPNPNTGFWQQSCCFDVIVVCMATEFWLPRAVVFPMNSSTNKKSATGSHLLFGPTLTACNRQVNQTHLLHLNEIQGYFCWLLARAVPRPDYHATNAT